MATTTPNFGWAVPTSTDLVKDGAVAIETLGDSIDASLVDLKGGTTGQVLAKATGTDMDFTWSTPSAGSSNVAGKNGVLNSNFSIWQRGTTFSSTGQYGADRYYFNMSTNITISRQTTSDTTNLPFIQYCARLSRSAGATNVTYPNLIQSFETVNSIPYAGKTVTWSFYARKGANFSGPSSQIYAKLKTGTGTDQALLAGYTGEVVAIDQLPTLTTTWQRFSYTATLATNITELGFQVFYETAGTAGAADYFEVTGFQLEIASSASAYSPNAATFQGELAACQRYYYRQTADGSATFAHLGYARGDSGTIAAGDVPLPVTMRVSPTSIDYANIAIYDGATVIAAATASLTTNQNNAKFAAFAMTFASGVNQFRYYYIVSNNNSAGYLGFSAEL
jgi:hypothetical protein